MTGHPNEEGIDEPDDGQDVDDDDWPDDDDPEDDDPEEDDDGDGL